MIHDTPNFAHKQVIMTETMRNNRAGTLLSNRNRDVTYRNIPAISLVQHLAFKYFV